MENQAERSSELRLSRLSTAWTLLREAHGDRSSVAGQAKLALIERYENAVFRYLLAATKDRNLAEDLFQEFALRVLRGSFQNVRPDKGRFRDYVRRTLINLVNDEHRRAKRQRAQELPDAIVTSALKTPSDADFDTHWREEILELVWKDLKSHENETARPVYSILQLKLSQPTADTKHLTTELNRQLGASYSEANFRKLLQRAREKFAGQLLDEISRSLETCSLSSIEEEVKELGLLSYCRKAIEQRRQR